MILLALLPLLAQTPATPLEGWLERGVLGLVIVGLGGMLLKVYADKEAQRVAHEVKLDTILREYTTALNGVTAGMKDVSVTTCAALQRLTEQLELAKRLEAIERRGSRANGS
jgi:hypothetical protein